MPFLSSEPTLSPICLVAELHAQPCYINSEMSTILCLGFNALHSSVGEI